MYSTLGPVYGDGRSPKLYAECQLGNVSHGVQTLSITLCQFRMDDIEEVVNVKTSFSALVVNSEDEMVTPCEPRHSS